MKPPSRSTPAWALIPLLALASWTAGCGEETSTGPDDEATVVVAFQAVASASATHPAGAATRARGGTLELDDVYLVVDEFKLEGNEDACEGTDPAPDCAKFEADPHLLSVPLAEGESEVAIEETAPPGTFTWLKFETKAVGGNPAVDAAIEAEGITDWPGDASLMVTGVFTPEGAAGGEPFRVFFDAEVKIVLPLPDPLVLTEEESGAQIVVVHVDPHAWFLDEEGSALDLGALDYDTGGQVHDLEVKLEDGFTKIEIGG